MPKEAILSTNHIVHIITTPNPYLMGHIIMATYKQAFFPKLKIILKRKRQRNNKTPREILSPGRHFQMPFYFIIFSENFDAPFKIFEAKKPLYKTKHTCLSLAQKSNK